MRLYEFCKKLSYFTALLRVNGVIVKTNVEVETLSQARKLLSHLFGSNNVLSVSLSTMTEEGSNVKTLSSDELKVQSLAQQREKYSKAVKQEKARQSLVKAQNQMLKVNSH